MQWLFGFFFISGFCSILYELVWLRLSMAQFGVTTALVSIVLSSFMAGLGLGSWGSGKLIRKYGDRLRFPALRFYAVTELLIGISALLVPYELSLGRVLLEHWGSSSSFSYYVASGIWVAVTLVPWCACMGATIPVAMLSIKRTYRNETSRSFSFLYLANVLGAVAGAGIPLLLIELYGFHRALEIGAALNFLLAAGALALSWREPAEQGVKETAVNVAPANIPLNNRKPLVLLFATGLTSMGMEVVWIRLFSPYLGTVVYAFAMILGVYLIAMFYGSLVYRRWSRQHSYTPTLAWPLLGLSALLPLGTSGGWFSANRNWTVVLGVFVFSAILGFVTPMLVDRWSGGDPERAGSAYAVNVVGCILGPLLSGFLLLPFMSERWVLFVLAVPWLLLGIYPEWLSREGLGRSGVFYRRLLSYGALALSVVLLARSADYEKNFARYQVLRDHTATVIATGESMHKTLLVNGVGITFLTPITKMMAHLPLASLGHPPKNALVICFGMGTTYRSMLSWGIPAAAVELVPSVPKLFGYYHSDGPELLQSPMAHVVIDDGRRYLERTAEEYDVITLDPPPPVEAAGSSLLYSRQFYSTIKQRLRSGGILQQWLPGGDAVVHAAVARALEESFPHVRVFRSVEHWGYHFLASEQPIPDWTPGQLVQHMPGKAVEDMMEWGPQPSAEKQFAVVLDSEFPLERLIAEAPGAPALEDDRPVNEYYALRRKSHIVIGLLTH